MKPIRYALASAVLVVSAQALSGEMQQRHVATTADLVELCSVNIDDPGYEAAMGFCLGYIDAAMDYHAALTEGPRYESIACPQETVTREEVRAVFVDWSTRNTQHFGDERPVTGVMRAAAEKWPCRT